MDIISTASNIRTGTNPTYTHINFLAFYPQFGQNKLGDRTVPLAIIDVYINLANACLKQVRWQDYWEVAMGLFTAHFVTLWLQSYVDINNDSNNAMAVMEAGKARGLNTSESVGDVSVGTDYGLIGNDIEGWAAWKLTTYGIQLATFGKLVGMGNMYVY